MEPACGEVSFVFCFFILVMHNVSLASHSFVVFDHGGESGGKGDGGAAGGGGGDRGGGV